VSDGSGAVAANSVTVASWTVISRVAGFLRGATIAAVLGPTYFANSFQGVNLLPNLTYELLTGSLFASLLVPRLVRRFDVGDDRGGERLAGGFLGLVMAASAVVAAVALAAGPLVLRIFSAGVPDAAVAAEQRRVGLILLAMFLPQVVLYAVAGTAGAALNARGRFAIAAAAPALENLGVVATLVANAVVFGTGRELGNVGTSQLLLLGLGTTGAVVLHAGALWTAAWRAGVRLVPRRGWRDEHLRELIAQLRPSLGYTALNVVRLFTILVVANRVPGGIVAFQLALNFFYFPVAVGARPVAVALLPELARHFHEGANRLFRDELVRGVALGLFLTIPAAVAIGVLASPLARAVALGDMATPRGRTMIVASLATLAFGLVGEGVFVMATNASYARHDATSPFRSSVVRTVIVLGGMGVAFLLTGTSVLVALGIALSVSNILGALHLSNRLRVQLGPGTERLAPAIRRAGAASALMAVPAWLIANGVPRVVAGRPGNVVGVVVAAAVGIATFAGLQRRWRSPELHSLADALRGRGRGAGPAGAGAGAVLP
jgi:putative peptidoglycan lipid II flippase